MRNLEQSQRFLASAAGQRDGADAGAGQAWCPRPMGPGGAPGGVEFEILSGYNPLPPGEGQREKDAAKAEGWGERGWADAGGT